MVARRFSEQEMSRPKNIIKRNGQRCRMTVEIMNDSLLALPLLDMISGACHSKTCYKLNVFFFFFYEG